MSTLVKSHFSTPGYLNTVLGKELFKEFGNAGIAPQHPAVNVLESKESFLIELAAPGFQKSDFKLNLERQVLTISLQKEEENQDGEMKYTRREYTLKSFERSFNLPQSIDGDKISATYEAGILRVNLPKKEEAKEKPAREIEIQ
ncbi:Hsp20/alpha crystallin family protein [Dyadobacter tibetensis]|uniref:Hsp20/alpha crystallin family protein n=1 Tax=Dyadobacter tibetensis TaxID=1211851 RepID=UPI00047112F3|nr:Hsp20/alpha crystallin family protein [Dyadobacter tibetensis]